MDKIQKALIEAGRKDLAQEYYKKTAKSGYTASDWVKQVEIVLKKIHSALEKIKKDKGVNAGTESSLKQEMKFLNDWMGELDKGIQKEAGDQFSIGKRNLTKGIMDPYRIVLPKNMDAMKVMIKFLKDFRSGNAYGDEIGFDNGNDRNRAYDLLNKKRKEVLAEFPFEIEAK